MRIRHRMPEAAHDLPSGSVAARARKRSSAGCDDNAPRGELPVTVMDGEIRLAAIRIARWRLPRHVVHPASGAYLHAKLAATPDQRVDDRARAIADREELAGLLPLQLHAHCFEPAARRVHVERGQDVANGIARSVEVVGMDFIMSDVAAAAARDEYLRADAPRRFEHDNPCSSPVRRCAMKRFSR